MNDEELRNRMMEVIRQLSGLKTAEALEVLMAAVVGIAAGITSGRRTTVRYIERMANDRLDRIQPAGEPVRRLQ